MFKLQEWFNKLTGYMAVIPRLPSLVNFEFVMHSRLARPLGMEALEDLYRKDANLLDPVIDFHERISRLCRVEYRIRLPERFQFVGSSDTTGPLVFSGGVQVLDCEGILMAKRECISQAAILKEIVGKFGERFGASIDSFEKQLIILQECIPFCQTENRETLAIVPERAGVEGGIYHLVAGESKRLCATFHEWLSFLEHSCYAGPSWSMLQFWHDGERLILRPELTAQLLNVFEINCPGSVTQEDGPLDIFGIGNKTSPDS